MTILKDDNGKPIKTRTWKVVFYPESAPSNWEELLEEEGLPIAISPCHDSDVEEDGTPKKPHYHLIIQYPSPTTSGKAQKLSVMLGNSPYAKPSENLNKDYDYLTHKRNKNKHQYNDIDIKILGGFMPPKAYNPTFEKEQKKEQTSIFDGSLFAFIRENACFNLGTLVAKLFENGMIDEYIEVKKNSYFWGSICKSLTENANLVRAYESLHQVTQEASCAVNTLMMNISYHKEHWQRLTSDDMLAIHNANISLEKITTEMEKIKQCL